MNLKGVGNMQESLEIMLLILFLSKQFSFWYERRIFLVFIWKVIRDS
jgi:hypothetical protein